MKFCGYCGKQLDDNASFCFACGKEVVPDPINWEQAMYAEEEECLNEFYRFFKYERLAWKIQGIVFLVLSLVMIAFGVLFLAASSSMSEQVLGPMYLMYGIMYLPMGIIGLKMVGRAEYYMDTLYTDTAGMAERAGAVGMIVLAALFNNIALIFIIINFVRVKSNKAVLDRIIARQNAARYQGR